MGLHAADCHSLGRRTSPCGRSCRVCAQLFALRRFCCPRCKRMVLICRACDRGQRYCAAGCAKTARKESLRRAGRHHQATHSGRRHHAARQARYLRRQKQKVTHQGPPQQGAHVKTSLSGASTTPEKESSDVPKRPVPILPPSLLLPMATSLPTPASSPRPLEKEHVCHFCRVAKSAYLRIESVCYLHRRLVRDGARGAPRRRI
jgi:hypothetical protein